MIKFLAPLTDNPNSPSNDGKTPIHEAAWRGKVEIVKFLAPLTEHPNSPCNDGKTPIYVAAENRLQLRGMKQEHIEIVKFLAPLTDNPDAPDEFGNTPSSVTKRSAIRKFLKSFDTSSSSRKPNDEPLPKRAKKF